MRGVPFLACVLTVGVCLAGPPSDSAAGKETEPAGGIQIAVDAVDGSHLRGSCAESSLRLLCAFGPVELPLRQVQKITMCDDRERAVVAIGDGDRLTGVPSWAGVVLKGVFGELTVPMPEVRQITVFGPAGELAGLVLWNTLGSPEEVRHSRVGPAGVFRGGQFTPGVAGGAWTVRHDQSALVAFPREVIAPAAGCIELWARLSGAPPELRWGQNPSLFRLTAPEGGYLLHLNGNDGGGGGGLCGDAGTLGGCATGAYGNWTYAQVLKDKDAAGWHHYALVWDKNGIRGVGDGTRKVAVFLDGVMNATYWRGGSAVEPVRPSAGELELMLNQHLDRGDIAIDEIKVWSHAKTDFRESLRFAPRNADGEARGPDAEPLARSGSAVPANG